MRQRVKKSWIVVALVVLLFAAAWNIMPKRIKGLWRQELVRLSLYWDYYREKPTGPADASLWKELAVVVTSCDKRSHLWHPQWTLLLRHWPSLTGAHDFIPLYLVSNHRHYDHPRVQTIAVGEDVGWSDNLIVALREIPSQYRYILIMMDDHMLSQPMEEDRFLTMFQHMQRNQAAYVSVVIDKNALERENPRITRDGIPLRHLAGVVYRHPHGLYKASLEAALWDRQVLEKLLVPGESAWIFEERATIRSKKLRQPFYGLIADPPMVYVNAMSAKGSFDPAKASYVDGAIDFLQQQGVLEKSSR
jgi:hypothetical protein